jgi:acyl-CoA synthetase (NDP forming)
VRRGDPLTDSVRALLEPCSIAVVGASARPGSFGERMVAEVLRSSAELDVHLVNPRYGELAGRSCVASLDDVPQPVDLVLLGVGDMSLEAELSRAAKRGDRAAVIFGNAYEPPVAGQPSLRARLAAIARDAGMAVCGGGCMGFVNVVRGVRAIGYVEPDPIDAGPVAVVTHSGSVFSALLRARRGFGYSVAVSSGQELVTTTAAYLDYALSLPETGVIALVLEAIRDAAALRRAFDSAAERDVPVVVLPVGTSERGRAMVAAHSGAVAGGVAAWEALADAHGLRLVSDLGELLDTVELFAVGRRARSPRTDLARRCGVAAVLDSGAERALLVDVAAEVGVEFAELAEATTVALSGRLDPGLVAGNPLDVWGNGADTEGLFTDMLTTLAADDATQAVALAIDLVPELDGDESYPRAVLAAHAGTDAPVVVMSHVPSALDLETAARLRAAGVPVLEGTRSGLRAVRHLLDHAAQRRTPKPAQVDVARRERALSRLAADEVSAVDGLALLQDYGIAVPAARAADHEGAVLAAAAAIGYPVVLKTDEAVPHKTDVAGVTVGLRDDVELAAAYRDIAERLGPNVVVCEQVPAGVELLVGAVRDPSLGMLLVVGAGGTLTEQLVDRVAALPPIGVAHAAGLLRRTAVHRLLEQPRGSAAADIGAVAQAIAAFSSLVVEVGDALNAIEINPLICSSARVVAVDVLVETVAKAAVTTAQAG